jgi:hypothetical protein
MSRRAVKASPTAAPHDCDEEKFMEQLDSNEPYALVRFQANQIFHVSIFHGVDGLTDRVKALFDAIPSSALAISPEASDRDILYKSLKMWMTIIQLAVFNGRPDLERMGVASHAGLVALEEREKGFDEPLLRARRRLRNEPRETFYVNQLKALSAEAVRHLQNFGIRDATSQVAKAINRGGFLPEKHNGKSVVARSISNWSERGRVGRPGIRVRWLFRPEMTRFRRASELWRQGRPKAAQQAVLQELSDRLKQIRRFDRMEMET